MNQLTCKELEEASILYNIAWRFRNKPSTKVCGINTIISIDSSQQRVMLK